MNKTLQFKLRIDEDLHAKVKASAEENKCSVNSELLRRISESFSESIDIDLPTSSKALDESKQCAKNVYKYFRGKVIEEIDRRIKLGKTDAYISFEELEIEFEDDPLLDTVIEPIIKELTDSGYSTNDWDLSGVLVMWAE
ncbi:Arc family DNA-binding protein [Vibrio sp. S234-5]|uniref:Arc family DNA-binding protein n=1 Tax=Vibrio sp. S234-5 TaxID=1616781 RepID=UPI001493FC6B|nr:Arc family DNA-binding protein [Vibrio sp. S234-5]